MRIGPEGPQGVVEVEDYEARQGLQVGEGRGRSCLGGGERGKGGPRGWGGEGFGEFSGHRLGVDRIAAVVLEGLKKFLVDVGTDFKRMQVLVTAGGGMVGLCDKIRLFGEMGGQE